MGGGGDRQRGQSTLHHILIAHFKTHSLRQPSGAASGTAASHLQNLGPTMTSGAICASLSILPVTLWSWSILCGCMGRVSSHIPKMNGIVGQLATVNRPWHVVDSRIQGELQETWRE